MKAVTQEQRLLFQEAVAKGEPIPETRLKMNNIGKLEVVYTEKMVVSEEFSRRLKDEPSSKV